MLEIDTEQAVREHLRAYPKTSAACQVIQAQAKCTKAR
jgi:hypothetical protein